MKSYFLILSLSLILLVVPVVAQTADTAPVSATFENLVKAAARLGAIDLKDDRVLDDYARIVHCDLYQRYHGDEFTWRDVRNAMRQSIALHKDSFPVSFYLYRTETFGAYDFATHTLPLTGDAIMRRTADLEMLHFTSPEQKFCDSKLDVMPMLVVAILDKALQMEAIPVSEDRAARVVRYFDSSGSGRIGYGRYLVTLHSGEISNIRGDQRLNFGAHLDNIEFALDSAFQGIFWTGIDTPIITKAADDPRNALSGIPFKGIDTSRAPDTEPEQSPDAEPQP
jgi:hypothetical protein